MSVYTVLANPTHIYIHIYIYIRCIHGTFGREITRYMVINGECINRSGQSYSRADYSHLAVSVLWREGGEIPSVHQVPAQLDLVDVLHLHATRILNNTVYSMSVPVQLNLVNVLHLRETKMFNNTATQFLHHVSIWCLPSSIWSLFFACVRQEN